ncbi:MAG TPA: hypothetical protein VK174_18560 [Chitinophagales bacterium]|nr:hypothetical protein [Chitinophagales bacterium]
MYNTAQMSPFAKLYYILFFCCLVIAARAQQKDITIDAIRIKDKTLVLYTSDEKSVERTLHFKDGIYIASYKQVDFIVNFDSVANNAAAQKLATEAREQHRPRYKEPMVNTVLTIVYDSETVYWITPQAKSGKPVYEEQLNKAKGPKLYVNEKKTCRITVVRAK